jgi:uncharacterized protein (DUF488 family)
VDRDSIYTVGHSTRALEDFLKILEREGIARLADVRTFPASRRYPHFNQDALAASLAGKEITYAHLAQLGGRRAPRRDSRNTAWKNSGFRGYADYMETREFEDGLRSLLEYAAGGRTAIMCAEAVPWRCHRSMISDALVARGESVLHILDSGTKPHTLTSFARVVDGRVRYRDAENPELFDSV